MDKQLIHEKILAIQDELDPIAKNQKADAKGNFPGYKYRGIDDAVNALNPLLRKNGVHVRSEVVSIGNALVSRYHFVCGADGSSTFTDVLITGPTNKPQDGGVIASYGYKIAAWTIFSISTEENQKIDPDNAKSSNPDSYKESFKSKICKLISVADNAGAEWVYLKVASAANEAKLPIKEYAKINLDESTIEALYKEYLNWKDNETNK